jgi:hypothetical protein
MKTENKDGYLLLFRGTEWDQGLAPEKVQQIMGEWKAWYDGLMREGKCRGGEPLWQEGKIVSGKKGKVVADGPFAESKEAIGGYFRLEVQTLDEAVAIAQRCPSLEYGTTVEVRAVAHNCPIGESVGITMKPEKLATAGV